MQQSAMRVERQDGAVSNEGVATGWSSQLCALVGRLSRSGSAMLHGFDANAGCRARLL